MRGGRGGGGGRVEGQYFLYLSGDITGLCSKTIEGKIRKRSRVISVVLHYCIDYLICALTIGFMHCLFGLCFD